jgi:hypothetical protein
LSDDSIEVRGENNRLVRRERCDNCPLDKLDRAFAENPIIQRVVTLDGFQLSLDDLDVEEHSALMLLRSERNKHQAEQIKNPSGR